MDATHADAGRAFEHEVPIPVSGDAYARSEAADSPERLKEPGAAPSARRRRIDCTASATTAGHATGGRGAG